MKPPEEWRPVRGHEARYEVSDLGRVRTIPRTAMRGCVCSTPKTTVLTKSIGGRANNYHRVMLHREDGTRHHIRVHHLVLEAFVGPRPPEMLACHKNDEGFDNRLKNLYWGTEEDNQNDRYLNKLDLTLLEPSPF